jgi:ATP-dependent Clp protease protease subunit
MAMIDVIKSSRVPVATIVEGKAMSCGAVLLSFGAEGMRFAGPNSTIMIHEVTGGSFGRADDIKVDAKQIEKLNDKILSMISTNMGKSSGYVKEQIHENNHADWFLDPEEAKAINLVNHVRIPELSLSIDVKFKFE